MTRMKQLTAAVLTVLMCTVLTVAAWASPLTGDTSNMGLWIAMMVIAAVVLVALVIIMIKRNKK